MGPIPEEVEEKDEEGNDGFIVVDGRNHPTEWRAEEKESRAEGASRREDRQGAPDPREGRERSVSPPSTTGVVEDAAEDQPEPEDETPAAGTDERIVDAPPVLVFDRTGVPALLPLEEGKNFVPESNVKLTADQADKITALLGGEDWDEVDRYRERIAARENQSIRNIIERDAAEKDLPMYRERLEEYNQKENYKQILKQTAVFQAIMDAPIDEQAVALGTAMNGSHGGSSASRLAEAEQGAGEAEASHPNFLQQASAALHDHQPNSDGSSSAASNELRQEKWRVEVAQYKYCFFTEVRNDMIDKIKEMNSRVVTLKRKLRDTGHQEDLLATDSEDDSADKTLDKNAALEVPGGKDTDIGSEEIEYYTSGQLFQLCVFWQESWTKAKDFSLDELAQRINRLAEQESELTKKLEVEASREETITQLSAYSGLFKVMRKSSKKQLKRFMDMQAERLASARSGLSRKMRRYTMSMAATWSEKVTMLRDFRARNQSTLFGLRVASRGFSILSRSSGGTDVDVVGAFDAATSSEPAFTEAFRSAALHHFRGDPEVLECLQNTLTMTINGDGGEAPEATGMEYPASQEARQRNAAESREAAEAGISIATPERLNAMVDLSARRIFGSGLSEDRILQQTGRERENDLPVLRDFATNRERRPDGPGDELAKEIFRAVATRDPKEVLKNCEIVQNLSASRPVEQKVPRAQRSAQRELMQFLRRMSEVTDDVAGREGSRSSGSAMDVTQPDPPSNDTQKRITVAAMRKLLHRARENGTLSLRKLGSEGELEGLFQGATMDAIEEAIGTEGAETTGTYLQIIDSHSMPGPVVRRAIDQALVTRGGPDGWERGDQSTDLDRMLTDDQQTNLHRAFQAAARRDPRQALLEAADLMETSTSQSRVGVLSWPMGFRDGASPTSWCPTGSPVQSEAPTIIPSSPTIVPATPTLEPDLQGPKSSDVAPVPEPGEPEENAAAGSKDPPGLRDGKPTFQEPREPSSTDPRGRAASRGLSGQPSAPYRQVGNASENEPVYSRNAGPDRHTPVPGR